MQTISELLKQKGVDIISVSPSATVFDALTLMSEKDIGALLVLDGQNLAGILSERDYARKVALLGRSSREMTVREIMTDRVFHIDAGSSIQDCMQIMTDKRIRHLPVYDNGSLAGVISIGDIVKAIIQEQEFVISQLNQYISGGNM